MRICISFKMKVVILLILGLSIATASPRSKRDLMTVMDSMLKRLHIDEVLDLIHTYATKSRAVQMVVLQAQSEESRNLLEWILKHQTFMKIDHFARERGMHLTESMFRFWNIVQSIHYEGVAPRGDLREFYNELQSIIDLEKVVADATLQLLDPEFSDFYRMMQGSDVVLFFERTLRRQECKKLLDLLIKNGIPFNKYIQIIYDFFLWPKDNL